MLSSQEITDIINQVYDGVEKSKLGKIIDEVSRSDNFPNGKRLNHLPMNTFLTILSTLIRGKSESPLS